MKSRLIAAQLLVLLLLVLGTSLAVVLHEIRPLLAGSFLFAAVVLVILPAVFHRTSTRSLKTVAGFAARIGRGEPGGRLQVEPGAELYELAVAFNETAVYVEEQLGRLAAQNSRLGTILSSMGEGVMVADPQGVIVLVNPACRELFALCDGVEGKQLFEISRHPALHHSFRLVVDTRQEHVEELQLHAGKEQTLLTHWVPLLENGELEGAVAVFHDISDIRHLEKIRRDFVANVSHELRTPVTVIKGYAETLLGGELENDPAQGTRFIGIIYAHANRLAALIADLLTLSQLESGTVALQSCSVRLHEVAEHVVTLLEEKARQRSIAIDVSAIRTTPAVLADPGRLEQVFFNLLDNAIKYSPAGASVTLSAALDQDRVRVAVKDTGHGIPAKDLPRIFERFYRVDTARSRDEGGTGLGLAIVKHIVQLLGGTVAVESSGKGSTFFVTLQRAAGSRAKRDF